MKITLQEDWLQSNGKYQCPHCSKEYSKKGICSHIWRTHGDGQNFTANIVALKEKGDVWNKGLTKDNDDRILKASNTYKENIKNGTITPWNKGIATTAKHKKAISDGMKLAHKEGRAHNIGQSRWNNKMSYPEKFFTQVIANEFEDKNYLNEYPVGIFSIDFAWVDKKLAIEIDGDQHEKPEYKARDKRKDIKLDFEGWKVLRIKWKNIYHNPKEWIQIAKDFIDGSSSRN